ncbi:ABC transporter ATP-binding protein [Fusibacter paucivorans]|uniref:Nickel import system ATP-binding protein NikD n=1 Tax=Fusibacter paucivorans TaxID=76009 RepID=A0ABS5PR13_9FIRM|nr:ABC transporter ATP-binding protein [Fusibacter paucivorans]MBS7527501.1 ABC transporter ATP-binding protein [Fusibacter paucivorans]
MTNELLSIKDLEVWYKTYRGYAKVVNGVNLTVNKGEKVGVVGESGCGKTTTMKSILRMNVQSAYVNSGEILYSGENILKMNEAKLQEIRRRDIAMISQEPSAALNPVFTIGEQIRDVIRYSDTKKKFTKEEMQSKAIDAIKSVMISDPERILASYPYQLSGGMKQRICIAMGLVVPRNVLIADEPGTALDVTIQDQIHRLLHNLVEEKDMSLIMITHSLGVARELVDRIHVMYAGDVVEVAKTDDLFKKPLHPYTIGLLDCVPKLSGGGISEGIYGYVPSYINPAPGCRFASRCPKATQICREQKPSMTSVDAEHSVACFNYQ